MNLASVLDDSALRHPERIALEAGRRTITFAQLQRASIRAAALLARAGVEPGDRVGLVLPNVCEFAAGYFGILRTGAVVVPLSAQSSRPEVAWAMADAGAGCALVWRSLPWTAAWEPAGAAERVLSVAPGSFYDIPGAAPALGRMAERAAGDTAAILYTSGSGGSPKGVELTHDNLLRNARVAASLFALQPGDTVLGALPLFHCFGQTCVLVAAIVAGGRVLLVERFDAAAADRLLRDGAVTVAVGMPSMFAAIVALGSAQAPARRRLRLAVAGGAPLREDIRSAFAARFGCTVIEGYGLTETSPVACFDGQAIEGVEVRLAGGEILVRGHNVMKGYWRRPDDTAAALSSDGWLRTGDLGELGADGRLRVVGRLSDMIIRDGINIAPAEIEAVLCAHPAVAEAVAFAIADPIRGEEVLACAAPHPGAGVTEAELAGHLEAHLARDKQPRLVWLVDALPRGATGKVDKAAIAIPERVRRALGRARYAA